MIKTPEFCGSSGCPTVSTTPSAEVAVVQGYVTENPSKVKVSPELFQLFDPAVDTGKGGIAADAKYEPTVEITGMPLSAPEGSLPPGESLVLVSKEALMKKRAKVLNPATSNQQPEVSLLRPAAPTRLRMPAAAPMAAAKVA